MGSLETQVTIEYRQDPSGNLIPLRVDTIVISTQHAAEVTTEALREEIHEKIIQKVIPKNMLDERTIYHIQPSGRFVIGGPQGDAGVTGRKIIVDTYGGWGAHGGGAFSGKVPETPVFNARTGCCVCFCCVLCICDWETYCGQDYSKVDRSAAYAARWVAKSLVTAGLCRRALVQLSYAIGVAEPLSIFVETYGTSQYTSSQLVEIVRKNFDLRPGVLGIDPAFPLLTPSAHLFPLFSCLVCIWSLTRLVVQSRNLALRDLFTSQLPATAISPTNRIPGRSQNN